MVGGRLRKRRDDTAQLILFGPRFFDRVGVWNEELTIPLGAGDAQSSILRLDLLDATLREEGLKACTFHLGDFVPWNGYHLDVRQSGSSLQNKK